MRRSLKNMAAVLFLCVATTIVVPAQTFTSLISFDGTNGWSPYYVSLVQGADGNLFGTTYQGGFLGCNPQHVGCGTVFSITPDGVHRTIYDFCSQTNCADGSSPFAGLVLGTDGDFYGTTSEGGSAGYGTVFKITSTGKLTTLHNFVGGEGTNSSGTLIQARDGNFYGTTSAGGANASGTVFKMTPTGTLTTIYSFCSQANCPDGANPYSGLIQATDGSFRGTTSIGGNSGAFGTVFRITATGVLTTLYSFNGGTDGGYPYGSLLQASDGSLYGTTESGTIFKMKLNDSYRTIYTFPSNADPFAGLIQATDSNLYGTTSQDIEGYGTVFSIGLKGNGFGIAHFFDDTDGANPYGGLVQATNGNFYGTTFAGGSDNDGTIFTLSTGLGPFVSLVSDAGRVGQTGGILGQGFTGTTSVSLNGIAASFTVVSDTFIRATVPSGATTGLITVTTPSGTLTSNKLFRVLP